MIETYISGKPRKNTHTSQSDPRRDNASGAVSREGDVLRIVDYTPSDYLMHNLKETEVGDWKQWVDYIMIDFNYNGKVFTPTLYDMAEHPKQKKTRKNVVSGHYGIPETATAICVKIADLISEHILIKIPNSGNMRNTK